jgi:hypothetical protein
MVDLLKVEGLQKLWSHHAGLLLQAPQLLLLQLLLLL